MTQPITVSETARKLLAGTVGVTPGPWLNVNSIDQNTMLTCEVRQVDTDPTNKHHWPFRVCHSVPGQFANADKANFDHIANCDPQTIASICQAYLAALEEIERLKDAPLEIINDMCAETHPDQDALDVLHEASRRIGAALNPTGDDK